MNDWMPMKYIYFFTYSDRITEKGGNSLIIGGNLQGLSFYIKEDDCGKDFSGIGPRPGAVDRSRTRL